MTREELHALAMARVRAALGLGERPSAPSPTPPTPRTPRVIPAPTAAPWLTTLHAPRAFVRIGRYDYRVSRPRDYNPEQPIHFVGVAEGGEYTYIGLIRPPGHFMWGRKSSLSASDPRVLTFDAAYQTLLDGGTPEITKIK